MDDKEKSVVDAQAAQERANKLSLESTVPRPWFSSKLFNLILTSYEIDHTNDADNEMTDQETGTDLGKKKIGGKKATKRGKSRKNSRSSLIYRKITPTCWSRTTNQMSKYVAIFSEISAKMNFFLILSKFVLLKYVYVCNL